ncbi:MAG TPA: TonB-dependent receptor [Ignavibacteria bacterium]|nr:TonB-dependent receptor [Ignavibacteria bacterium]
MKNLILYLFIPIICFSNTCFAQDTKKDTVEIEIIEINRATDRETPVAFSNIGQLQIEEKRAGQDAPLLVRNVPGFYAYSTDGAGNGEAQLLIRGFNQNYVQVMINGIPTNDPESNSVYWSNWGSVSSNAGSIQIQRGAGSSLYGAGSFGGSFNIQTLLPDYKRFIGLTTSYGDPLNTLYGLKINSGKWANNFNTAFTLDRKIAEGTRIDGRYEGLNYYFSTSYQSSSNVLFNLILHGAPQEHGYSFSQNSAYFSKFGYKANPANFLPKTVVEQLPPNGTTGVSNYGLLADNGRDLVGPKYVDLAHNFFHKPQLELHNTWQIDPKSFLRSTFFWSMGRGGGSSLNSAGTLFSLRGRAPGVNGFKTDTLITNYYGPEGFITDPRIADTIYLRNAFQRISYSLHSQVGFLTSYSREINKDFNLTLGGEFRNWKADHPGHFVNLYGKTSVTQSYAADTSTTPGVVKLATFSRRVYQGDLDGPSSDINPFDVFNWNLGTAKDPTYRTQYRNYLGETPQFTLFTQGYYQIGPVNFMGTFQYVYYSYKLKENMPSENSIGKLLSVADANTLGLIDSTKEGLNGNGKFYMRGTNSRWYEFNLVNETRSRGFVQPKFGFNWNINQNWNFFGNFSHVERFVDLSIYYNQGRVFPNAEDEKSNQFEGGFGFINDDVYAKINGYYMSWDNKSARIQDISQAGQPGYDRNGFRSELIGSSEHKGIEVEWNYSLNKILTSLPGFNLAGSFTYMDNKWTEVLEAVKTNPNGTRRSFNSNALDMNGNVDTLFFDELVSTPVASGPQLMTSLSLQYNRGNFFGSLDWRLIGRNYALDGGTFLGVNSSLIGNDAAGREIYSTEFRDQLPSASVFDITAGADFNLYKTLSGTLTLQCFNLFDTEYLAAADRFGIIPGALRQFRANLSIGF